MPAPSSSPHRRGLTPRQRAFVALGAHAAFPRGRALAGPLARARALGVSPRALEELGLMLHLHAGFPAAIEFLRVLRETERAGGARALAASRARASGDARDARAGARELRAWRTQGETLCGRIYGDDYAALRTFTRRLHPAIDAWMIVDGYGKTLSRPGLGALERELATVAVLAALGWRRQLAAHRAGAMRVGASARAVREAEALGLRANARSSKVRA